MQFLEMLALPLMLAVVLALLGIKGSLNALPSCHLNLG